VGEIKGIFLIFYQIPGGSPVLGAMNKKRILRQGATSELQGWAHQNRNAPTQAEEVLWEALRNRRLAGLRFRSQHGYGAFIFDFYCPAYKLVVEVDGGYHTEIVQARADAERDEYLAGLGFRTLRFTNAEVFEKLPVVLKTIKETTTA
jgi:very-short-patch-repair endonuclease